MKPYINEIELGFVGSYAQSEEKSLSFCPRNLDRWVFESLTGHGHDLVCAFTVSRS